MPTILDQLADEARERVAAAKAARPLAELRARVADGGAGPTCAPNSAGGSETAVVFPFEAALAAPGLSFICEVKKASPSKGLIAPDFRYLEIACEYDVAGAAAISVLTEPRHFLGADDYLREIAACVRIPILRKDFTVDEYQVFQARELGASAVLLICAILSPAQISEYLGLADELGLSCLVEAHTAAEVVLAVEAGARVIGVNNRDLNDFSVDTSTAGGLRALVPPGRLFVSESGVATPADAVAAAAMDADAVLVGEALMRAPDRRALLRAMREATVGANAEGDNPRTPVSFSTQVSGSVRVADMKVKEGAPLRTPAIAPLPIPMAAAAARTADVRVKICGISREADVPVLNETLPDYVGFVFATGSRRHVELDQALRLRALLDPRIATVGVFVDQPVAEIEAAYTAGVFSVAQLHGDEDAAFVAALRTAVPGLVIVKAVGVRDAASIVDAATMGADYLLLDNPRSGSGQGFDWAIVEEARALAAGAGAPLPPFFLAGGLRPETVGDARSVEPWGVDVSSGVETDGVKDARKIRAFVATARSKR